MTAYIISAALACLLFLFLLLCIWFSLLLKKKAAADARFEALISRQEENRKKAEAFFSKLK